MMGIEEGTFWDEHWLLYGNQFDNKFHILKKNKNKNKSHKKKVIQRKTDTICFHSYVDPEKLNRNPWSRGRKKKKKKRLEWERAKA